MAEIKAPVLMIPTGLLVGTGALMSFYSVTGLWGLWSALWPLQVIVVMISIGGAFWLGARGDQKEILSKRVANWLTRFTFITIVIVVGLSALPFG
jgi:hypothetical protein